MTRRTDVGAADAVQAKVATSKRTVDLVNLTSIMRTGSKSVRLVNSRGIEMWSSEVRVGA